MLVVQYNFLALLWMPLTVLSWGYCGCMHDMASLSPLIFAEVDATCSDFDFGTALHIAASNLCTSAVKCLLEMGANPAFRVCCICLHTHTHTLL